MTFGPIRRAAKSSGIREQSEKEGIGQMGSFGMFQNAEEYETYPPGHIIFKRGDPGTVMYVVKSGEVELQVENKPFTTLGPGEIIGEMALIDHAPRSLTAIAKTECHLVPIDQKRFSFLVQQTPFFALEVMKVMAERLRTFYE